MKEFLRWLLARLWKNYGSVTDTIYRSGQMGRIRLYVTFKLKKFKYVIGLNMDGSNSAEKFEKEYCDKHSIPYIHYNWSAGTNADPEQLFIVIGQLEENERSGCRTLIHCAGGRDRTGGAVGHWLFKSKRGSAEKFLAQCCRHKIPAEGWLRSVFSELDWNLII